MKKKSVSTPRRPWGAAWRAALIVGGIGLALLIGAVIVTMANLPGFATLMKSPNGQAVRVVSADGVVLVNEGPSYGGWLTYDQIPPVMVGAMLAVEDRRFFSHPGIDPIGLTRAVAVAVRDWDGPKATSTITQQLARNLFLTNERSFIRKGKEALLALAMERRFTKEQILELYLNRVYFGGGAYGIDAASRRFYGHSASELSAAEAAIIAGLVKAPSRFAPSSDPERARTRAYVVANTMARDGVVGDADALQREIAVLEFAPQPKQNNVRYFTDWVLQQVDDLTDERVEPLIVTTTLISRMQLAAEAAVQNQTPESAQGALVSMSPDGAVRAMMGGRDYVSSNYNRATIAERQPGSSWKLFVYLTAIENGITPNDIVQDAPITIDGWTPRNYGRGHRGNVTVRQAFANSYNTVAAQLGERVGFNNVAMMARRLGIDTNISRQPAMVLGTSTVRLLEMTAAYGAVANGGNLVEPYGITKIETASGFTEYEREPGPGRVVLAPWVATNMTNLLESVVTEGTGKAAATGRPTGGKTGTTSNYQDGYFVGFTADLVTGVWMGRDDNKAVSGLTGGSSPARAFAAYMKTAVEGMPVRPLDSDIGEEGDLFAEPDMEVYGIGADGWDDEEYYSDGYYGEDYAYDGEAASGPEASRRGGPDGLGARYAEPSIDPSSPDAQRSDRLGAADVPTRPRRSDAWLDEPVNGGSGAPDQPQPQEGRAGTANPNAPTDLLPPDPVQ